jgi:hypothetical protein
LTIRLKYCLLCPVSKYRRWVNEKKRINEPGSVFQGKKRDPGKSVRDQAYTCNENDQEPVEHSKEVQTVEKEEIIGL